MELTQEQLKKQAEEMSKNLEGYKQGYLMALSWAAAVLEVKEPEDSKEAA